MAVSSKPVVSPKKTPTKTNTKKRKNQEGDSSKEEGGGPVLVKKDDSSKVSENLNQPKGNKVPRVRVVGKRVYDSLNGKSCHQCRQKTLDFSAECKNVKNNKQCTIRFCHKCLINRYGEKAEDVSKLEDWKCPKCRFICNCSFCMKKKGQSPTGILVHTAKASGFMSVSQLLHVKGQDFVSQERAGIPKSPISKTVSPAKENAEAVSPNRCQQLLKSNQKKSMKLKKEKSAGTSEVKKDEGNASSQEKSTITDEMPKKKKPKVLSGFEAANPEEEIVNTVIGLPNGDKVKKDVFNVTKQEKSLPAIEKVKNKTSKAESVNQDAKPDNILEKLPIEDTVNKDGVNVIKQEKAPLPKEKINKKKIKAESVKLDDKPEEVLKKVHKLNPIESMVSKYENNASIQERLPITNDKPKQKLKVESDSCAAKPEVDVKDVEIVLPKGTEMKSLSNVDFSPEDIGNALQLLEFCAAFGEILDIKKGQPGLVLRDIMAGRSRRGKCSALVQFQIQLLSVIQKDNDEMSNLSPTDGKDCWLHALKECISEYKWALEDMPDHCFDGTIGYEMLSPMQKLKVVLFLCDETLSTAQLRTWMEDQNDKFKEKKKEAREKVTAAREKDRIAKKKMQDEIAAAILARNGSAPISIAEHEAMFTEIRSEAERVHAEMLETMCMVPKDDQLPASIRTGPIYFDANRGHVYWRLKGYNISNILLQDVGLHDFTLNERWYSFDDDEKKIVDEYISMPRIKKQRKQREKSTSKMEDNKSIPNPVPNLMNEDPK